jgi:hypothetical protein|tara:strand:+ start:78 stop:809 length:732 start_codon:yes stop_codon:yes gene_type:complete
MRKLYTLLFLSIISIGFSQNSEWTYLFDGSSMDGWHQYNSDKMSSAWSIEDGELVLDSNDDNLSRGNDIVTEKSYTNFELSLEWKVPKGGNSGVFFMVVEIPEVDAPWKTGPEIQVLDNENFVGPNTLYHQAPSLYDMKPIGKINYNPYGEWNHLVLKVDHNNNLGSITFNGEFVYSFPLSGQEWDKMVGRSKFSDDKYYDGLVPVHPYFTYAPFFGKFKTGKIGLQDHGWDVRYRNIKIREL